MALRCLAVKSKCGLCGIRHENHCEPTTRIEIENLEMKTTRPWVCVLIKIKLACDKAEMTVNIDVAFRNYNGAETKRKSRQWYHFSNRPTSRYIRTNLNIRWSWPLPQDSPSEDAECPCDAALLRSLQCAQMPEIYSSHMRSPPNYNHSIWLPWLQRRLRGKEINWPKKLMDTGNILITTNKQYIYFFYNRVVSF